MHFPPEETAKDLEEAKRAAAEANSTTAKVEDALSPIKKQLDEWQQQVRRLKHH